VDTSTGQTITLYEHVPGFGIDSVPSIAANRRYVARRNEISDARSTVVGELRRVKGAST
jgi:hypothetical protein